MDRFYLTTPIYYVNDVPHLGHAYTTVVGDALARYHRARGRAVYYLTGTDEHGQKIERAAAERQLAPIALADEVVERFTETWKRLNINYSDFIRTTQPRHAQAVQALWRRMEARGDIYLGDYDGLYCVACEEYYTETQLTDGRCPIHGTKPEQLKQPSYFFRMSRYQDALLDHFARHPEFVRPEIRRNEIVSFIKTGLRDLSISRTNFSWGIRVPGDEAHVVYVWVDALTNYISALGGFEAESALYRQFWPVDVHLIGKDILRFHAVYWPCMLLSAELPLPRGIFAHGWWTVNGQKMSKSLRNVVEPNTIATDVGCDALRYFLLRETPLGHDGDFAHEQLIQRINADLANDLGNLVNRSLAMAERYCSGRVPRFADVLAADDQDRALIELAERTRADVAMHFEQLAPSRALESLWELVRGANKYIDSTAPYKLAKDPSQARRVEQVVANFLEALRWIALMAAPAVPEKSAQILAQLGLRRGAADNDLAAWPERWGGLPEGHEISRGEPLFPRIDDERRSELLAKWTPGQDASASEATKTPTPKRSGAEESACISFEEFTRVDLRVATVLSAERIPGANKLLKLQLDLGSEQRQVVAGIASAYAPEALPGTQVVVVANLQPATIRGVRSEGMILAAGDKNVLALARIDHAVPAGTKVR